MLTTADNTLHQLNSVGSQIFKWLWESDQETSALLHRLTETFEVSSDQAEKDLTLFLEDLAKKGISLP